MFKVKAKTNSVKIKDINKYIGRVWVTLKEAEVLRSKDLLANKNKLVIQTDNVELKKRFEVTSTIKHTPIQSINIVQDKNIFVAQPEEKPVDKVDEVFIAEQPVFDFEKDTTNLLYTFDVDKKADELLKELQKAQEESQTIAEEVTPCQVESPYTVENSNETLNETPVEIEQVEEPIVFDEVKEDIIVDDNIIEVGEVEQLFEPSIQENEKTQIKNANNSIYKVKQDDISNATAKKRKRGRPKKNK